MAVWSRSANSSSACIGDIPWNGPGCSHPALHCSPWRLLLRALDADSLLDVAVGLVLQHEVRSPVFGQQRALQRVFLLRMQPALSGVLLRACESAQHFVFLDAVRVLLALLLVCCARVLAEGELLLAALLVALLLRGVARGRNDASRAVFAALAH